MKTPILFLTTAVVARAAVFGGTAGALVDGNMPCRTWDDVTKSHHCECATDFGPNLNPGMVLESKQAVAPLEAITSSSSYGCGLCAPESVPEPSSPLFASLAGILLLLLRRRCY